jgi:hypothetical protein
MMSSSFGARLACVAALVVAAPSLVVAAGPQLFVQVLNEWQGTDLIDLGETQVTLGLYPGAGDLYRGHIQCGTQPKVRRVGDRFELSLNLVSGEPGSSSTCDRTTFATLGTLSAGDYVAVWHVSVPETGLEVVETPCTVLERGARCNPNPAIAVVNANLVSNDYNGFVQRLSSDPAYRERLGGVATRRIGARWRPCSRPDGSTRASQSA